jgi:hypothetical protein
MNIICFRIFLGLVFALLTMFLGWIYVPSLTTPLALSVLPTTTADARYVDPSVWIQGRVGSPQKQYQSTIMYDGYQATLWSTTPPTPLVDNEALPGTPHARLLAAYGDKASSEVPVFKVRYVRALPSLVVLALPHPSLLNHLGQFWTPGEILNCLFYSFLWVVIVVVSWRHLRRAPKTRHRPRHSRTA